MLETFILLLLFSSLGLCGVAHRHSDKHRVVGSETSLSAHTVILVVWHLPSAMLLFQVAACLVLGQVLLIKTLAVYFSSQEWWFHSPLCTSDSGLYNCVSASPP